MGAVIEDFVLIYMYMYIRYIISCIYMYVYRYMHILYMLDCVCVCVLKLVPSIMYTVMLHGTLTPLVPCLCTGRHHYRYCVEVFVYIVK